MSEGIRDKYGELAPNLHQDDVQIQFIEANNANARTKLDLNVKIKLNHHELQTLEWFCNL